MGEPIQSCVYYHGKIFKHGDFVHVIYHEGENILHADDEEIKIPIKKEGIFGRIDKIGETGILIDHSTMCQSAYTEIYYDGIELIEEWHPFEDNAEEECKDEN